MSPKELQRYLRNLEILKQGKLPPGIIAIEPGQGKALKKRKRDSTPPASNKSAKKIKLIDLTDKEDAPLVDLTSAPDEGKVIIEVIDLD